VALSLSLAACVRDLIDPLPADPTPDAYLAHAHAEARLVAAGQMTLEGQHVSCAGQPTVVDPDLNDYAATYPRFIILNPSLMAKVGLPVQLWIYNHECGHHYRGLDEGKADCFAVEQGLRERWLTPDGLDQICEYIRPGRPDTTHFSGGERCEQMRACYAAAPKRPRAASVPR